jgi:hypothetical protein
VKKGVRSDAGAGALADSTIGNDTGHLDLIREWLGRPLWEVQPADADAYFGRVVTGIWLSGGEERRTCLCCARRRPGR